MTLDFVATCNMQEVSWLQEVYVYPGEPVQKGFGQPLAASPLLQRVLSCEDPEPWRGPECLPQLCYENLLSVV